MVEVDPYKERFNVQLHELDEPLNKLVGLLVDSALELFENLFHVDVVCHTMAEGVNLLDFGLGELVAVPEVLGCVH